MSKKHRKVSEMPSRNSKTKKFERGSKELEADLGLMKVSLKIITI
jgi:hypothetical protein